ncbi:hypothetical protein CCY99_02305 [Helicobacter sp. 16-1353]|uniref:STT3 domain-containing protein n=1 Tax=Helicobacter sp. 16-1353 TaxID=2004996 RepID=UPI000DCB4B9C|nr:STT3 domain-containing protein [Helicobacter sp. 16-1353]RAX54616.1 hypothetical protein CCY99_02305 [Helicobacter sp. 16-1353]
MFQKIINFKYFNICVDVFFILIAIFISIYAREAFVYYSSAFGYYFFDGNRILTTNDAYHFATATKDLIQGHIKDAFYPIASLEMPSILSAFFYYILPFSYDDLFFYLPIGLSSLVAIPIYLFTKDITNRYFGLFAAILTPLSIGYSNRSVGGYYDTDMLVLTFPMFGLYFLYRILKNYHFKDLIFAIIFFILSLLWHKVSATYILTAGIFIALFYTIIKDRTNLKIYEALGILIISISYINIIIKLILIAILLHFIAPKPLLFDNITTKIKSNLRYKSLLILLIGFAVFIIANGDLILSRLSTYITDNMVTSNSIVLHSTVGTIMELKPLDFSNLAERTMGDSATFVIGLVGILVMFIKIPKTLILLPFLLLSLASLKLGLRFSMFGATIFSMGFFYFIYTILNVLNFAFKDRIFLNITKLIIAFCFALFAILPNYYHTKNYIVPPVVLGVELNALNAIDKDSNSRDDITISWWDYGFMIPYYSHTRAIIQGTDLDGVNHFLSSFVLASTNQFASYNMAKLIAEAIDTKDKNLQKLHSIDRILHKYNADSNPKAFMESLKNPDFKAPELQHNIYIYLPFSILPIQTALDEFSDIDYSSGEVIHKEESKTLAQYLNIQKDGDSYILDGEYTFFPNNGTFKSNELKKSIQVQKFHIIEKTPLGLKTTTKTYTNDKTKLHIIYSKELDIFFAIDDRTNDSLTVQLFVYENYNKDLFTLIYSDKNAKAYKLK